jgi:glutathionyl-hydroquinone reductase
VSRQLGGIGRLTFQMGMAANDYEAQLKVIELVCRDCKTPERRRHMGELIDGRWERTPLNTKATGGLFRRKDASFRNWITPDGAAGPSGRGGFAAEAGRYHLYVSYACPWAHRTLIMRALKGLEEMIGLSVTHWRMGEDGWTFDAADGVVQDGVNGVTHLYQLYTLADPACTTRSTVPILWDKATRTIVSNESAEIIRMFGSAFDGMGAALGDYYPEAQRDGIDALNARIYDTLNNGVYKAGFTLHQAEHEATVRALFDTLDMLEVRLGESRYLFGDTLTEADIRLFVTLIRFDVVYHGHFKCNLRPVASYPGLWRFTRDLYQHPVIRPTVRLDHIKAHYYQSQRAINPSGVVPVGPVLDLDTPIA